MARHHNPRDKQNAQNWAREMLSLPNFYILDTETTGLGKQDEIAQLGLIDKDGTALIDTLIKPTVPMSSGAAAVNGITNKMLKDAPTLDDVYTTISAQLAGSHLVAYNMDFDWRMLKQTVKSWNLPMFRVSKRYCAMKQYAAYRGAWNNKRGSYRWHKLTEAADYENIEIVDAHSALGDVLMTLKLIEKMAE